MHKITKDGSSRVPTKDEIFFLLQLIQTVQSRGTLHFPLTDLVYDINRQNRTARLLETGPLLHPEKAAEDHSRIKVVFEALDWKVVDSS